MTHSQEVSRLLMTIYKRSVRVSPVAHLTLRSSGIAFVVETSNAEAHACMYIYINIYIIPMDVIAALLFDYKFLELPDSEESRTKRQGFAFTRSSLQERLSIYSDSLTHLSLQNTYSFKITRLRRLYLFSVHPLWPGMGCLVIKST